jgi:hypothetical protein
MKTSKTDKGISMLTAKVYLNENHSKSFKIHVSIKGNEYNIHTHHLFIDFKVAYDTIMQNEVYPLKEHSKFLLSTYKIWESIGFTSEK